MALLKKIRSATLIEALIATIIIVIIFVIASLVLNNILFNTFSKNTHAINNRIFEIEYFLSQKKIGLPYNEEYGDWNLEAKEIENNGNTWILIKAINSVNGKEVIKTDMYETN